MNNKYVSCDATDCVNNIIKTHTCRLSNNPGDINGICSMYGERINNPGPAPELYVNQSNRAESSQEKLYVRYLTDRKLQMLNAEIVILIQTATSLKYKYDGKNLIPILSPDSAYEVNRVMNIRDEYIRLNYPELIVEDK